MTFASSPVLFALTAHSCLTAARGRGFGVGARVGDVGEAGGGGLIGWDTLRGTLGLGDGLGDGDIDGDGDGDIDGDGDGVGASRTTLPPPFRNVADCGSNMLGRGAVLGFGDITLAAPPPPPPLLAAASAAVVSPSTIEAATTTWGNACSNANEHIVAESPALVMEAVLSAACSANACVRLCPLSHRVTTLVQISRTFLCFGTSTPSPNARVHCSHKHL